jgi:hypothetical protein
MATAKITSDEVDVEALREIAEPIAPSDDEVIRWARLQAHQSLAMIVGKIWRRARSRTLDRGLSLSLPYFDDGAMEMRQLEMEVTPRGRIMFVPAFVVVAARREIERIASEASMTEGTRRHLIELLGILEHEFGGAAAKGGRTRLAE